MARARLSWLRRALRTCWLIALAAFLAFGLARAKAAGPGGPGLDRRPRESEPAAAADFMDAYARGDRATAERVASPLYWMEWEGRGLSRDAWTSLLPPSFRPGQENEWIHFTYVGGVVDPDGFGHLLYTGAPNRGDGGGAPTVWRVDTDPGGRVIWAEMVWLFGHRGPTASVDLTHGLPAGSSPPELAARHARVLFGVRSEVGPEAYFVAEVDGAPRPRVIFFARDEDGDFRPGAWSFTGRVPPAARPAQPDPAGPTTVQRDLLAAYLHAIG